MRVDLRRADILVTMELLHGANILAVFQEVGREGMAQDVGGGPLGQAHPAVGFGHAPLHYALVKVMAATLTRCAIDVESGGRKDPERK